MGSKPRQAQYVTRLVLEKQRAIYWLCALLERDGPATRADARHALAELGYDQKRIDAMLVMGEPGQPGAREPSGPTDDAREEVDRMQASRRRELGRRNPWPGSALPR